MTLSLQGIGTAVVAVVAFVGSSFEQEKIATHKTMIMKFFVILMYFKG